MNQSKPIFISSDDHSRLVKIINDFARSSKKLPEPLRHLHRELQRAAILDRDILPAGTVSLHSRVQLRDLETDETEEWTLTLPEFANFDERKLSVLAPIGTAILGYSIGDEIEWDTPGGTRYLRVEKVEHRAPTQPEKPRSLYG
ncbi:MAG TPA: GreA/GreB family elongation factor [Opitutales bacterium]|nr:GreA/GreB family elongation factor [Opitutales bacterium]